MVSLSGFTIVVSLVLQDYLLLLPCHCSAGRNGLMKYEPILRMMQHLWEPQEKYPATCWSESYYGTWRNVSAWRGILSGSRGLPTIALVFTHIRGTQGCGPSSPHQNYTSWSSCVPRSHQSMQPPCSPGVFVLTRLCPHISMLSTVASCFCINTQSDSRQSRGPKGKREGELPRKSLCVNITEEGYVGCEQV